MLKREEERTPTSVKGEVRGKKVEVRPRDEEGEREKKQGGEVNIKERTQTICDDNGGDGG